MAELTRSAFDGVLDLLSGRYPSDEFAELRPRLTWDRDSQCGHGARDGAARLAILNAGTIPDRGLYGVFLAHTDGKSVRVGELDEEMVFESHIRTRPSSSALRPGASSTSLTIACWWSQRPANRARCRSGRATAPGARSSSAAASAPWSASCARCPSPAALTRLVTEHDLDPGAADNLLQFLADQEAATGAGSRRPHHRDRALPG